MQLSYPAQPCSSFVDRSRVLLCLVPCGNDALCSASCLQKHAEVSPWIGTSISCLSILGRSNAIAIDDAIRDSCLQETSDDMTPFQAGIVRGLSSLALGSLETCAETHSQFVKDFWRFPRCTEACRLESSSDEPTKILSFAVCVLFCTLTTLTTG
jgi:hypothetical protein